MRSIILSLLLIFTLSLQAQEEFGRIQQLKNRLESLAVDNPGLSENLKLDINVANVNLSNFLMALSQSHQLNISVSPSVGNTTIVNSFPQVAVTDLLLFLCKEYNLDIDFTGNIMSIKPYQAPPAEEIVKQIKIDYNAAEQTLSLDLQNDPLDKVFRAIISTTGKNLLYSNELASQPLNLFISNAPVEKAMEKLALVNNLVFSKSRDGFYLFNRPVSEGMGAANTRIAMGRRPYEVLDTINKVLNVNFKNTPISQIIDGLAHDLKLDIYTATPLEKAGAVTFTSKGILFDDMLEHIFESSEPLSQSPATNNANGNNSRNARNTNDRVAKAQTASTPLHFTFKKENNIYFFGTANQLSLRKVEIIHLMHRSVELLSDPAGMGRTAGRTQTPTTNYFASGNGGQTNNFGQQNNSRTQRRVNTGSNTFASHESNTEAIVNILPDEIKNDLDIKVDFELNSFLVSGPSAKINRFKKLVKEIDKPVPVVLIEVMILEVNKSSLVETGISWGIGKEPVNTQGKIFPSTDITLGANTVNKIIGGFDGFGSFNMGKVVPEFYAKIKAMEEDGNIKVKSTPKLSTLNGHKAHLSIGETTYYVVTSQSYFGSQVPTTSEIRNYAPIDAELAISIKPLVSGDGQVTLDINVVQSDFSSQRIEEEAPPGLTSREFSSIIRMQNQDLAILGGLEEKVKNDSGDGVPLLSRIPVVKWLFSSRKREDSKKQLSILIKPTVIL